MLLPQIELVSLKKRSKGFDMTIKANLTIHPMVNDDNEIWLEEELGDNIYNFMLVTDIVNGMHDEDDLILRIDKNSYPCGMAEYLEDNVDFKRFGNHPSRPDKFTIITIVVMDGVEPCHECDKDWSIVIDKEGNVAQLS